MPYLLPTGSLYHLNKQHGQLDALQLGPNNSVNLFVRFVLNLNVPMAMSISKLRELSALTDVPYASEDVSGGLKNPQPMLELIIRNATSDQFSTANNRGLFVTLNDQQHCYFMSDHPDLTAVLVSSIPFRHPSQVPDILKILRQQMTTQMDHLE